MNNLDRIIELEKLVELLEVTIQQLLQENKELKIKLIELEDRLNKNSSNSGLPSSKDIYRIEKKTRPKSDKNPGGQAGHKYNAYQIKTSDINVDIMPDEEICKCGGSLLLEEKYRTHRYDMALFK